MKLKISIIIGALSSLVFSSCLKDTPFMDVSNTTPIIQFGLSLATGQPGPFSYAGSTTGTADTAIAVVLASPQVLNDTVEVTVALDTTQITAYNSANDSSYIAVPSSMYSLTTTVKIPPGYRVGAVPVTFNFSAFPANYRYGFALTIVSATDLENPNNTIIVSGNSGTFMWLFYQ